MRLRSWSSHTLQTLVLLATLVGTVACTTMHTAHTAFLRRLVLFLTSMRRLKQCLPALLSWGYATSPWGPCMACTHPTCGWTRPPSSWEPPPAWLLSSFSSSKIRPDVVDECSNDAAAHILHYASAPQGCCERPRDLATTFSFMVLAAHTRACICDALLRPESSAQGLQRFLVDKR